MLNTNLNLFPKKEDDEEICRKLFADMIGNDIEYESPFKDEENKNLKKYLIYSDFTSSGKGLNYIETFIKNEILPTYANVHLTIGLCAERTAKFFEEAREILREYVQANENYSIIFHGQGTTGGVHKLIEMLNIKKYEEFYILLEKAYKIREKFNKYFYEKDKFWIICDDLVKQIELYFKELFVEINFCAHFRENGKNKTKCILCNKDVGSEGGYNIHINEDLHKKNKQYYDKFPNALFKIHENIYIYDFIDLIKINYQNKDNYLSKLIDDYEKFKPVIFYSLFEHNSNSLSWISTKCEINIIDSETEDDFYDKLESKLIYNNNRYIKIGSFTACSNITGLLFDVDRICFLMHKYNGFAFFDYASGAPYLQINTSGPLPDDYRELLKFKKLNNEEKQICFKDGFFFSPHKFLGGPNTPGVLIMHDRIHRNQIKPTQPGGGTVHFVYKDFINYIKDSEVKEESGTPNIIGTIRIGLIINLRKEISHKYIIERDEYYIKLFKTELGGISNLYILHDKHLKNKVHLPVYAFMISYDNKFLHPNFICALLNDLFGIQSRPGASCSPNYARILLGFDKDKNKFNSLLKLSFNGFGIFKPGYCRLNLPYFYPEYFIKYIIKCIKFVCNFGHLFLGLYEYEIKSGKFFFHDYKTNIIDLNKININQCKSIQLYSDGHKKTISSEDLDIVYNNVLNYLQKKLILDTFLVKEKKLFPVIKEYEFGIYENARWFLTFADIKNYLVTLYKTYKLGIKDENLNDYIQKDKIKRIVRMDDWSIKYQNENINIH